MILTLATFGQPTTARSEGVNHFTYKGRTVSAFFSSADPSGCIYTNVDVTAAQVVYRTPPGPRGFHRPGFTYLSSRLMSARNGSACGRWLGTVGKLQFPSLSDPKSAILNATVNVLSIPFTNSTFDVTIALTWAGASSLAYRNELATTSGIRCRIKTRYEGNARFATLSGSISDGVTDLATPPAVATIGSNKFGEHEAGCV